MFMFLSIHNKTKIVISFIFHVMLSFENKIKIKPLLFNYYVLPNPIYAQRGPLWGMR